ncbi:MAG: polysaccharide deacetylase family protein, partial [Polyangiaceae bacterium]|nr:polysaccharide deacetylase family protein [Polyangiaceae bacterium]
EDLPGVERSVAGAGPRLALTFDACDARGYDAELVAWLRSEGVRATLFVSGRFARRHPDVVSLLAEEPLFELGNHGYDHRPCAVRGERAFGIPGSRSLAEAAAEIERASDLLRSLGARQPRFYRSGTAHYDDVCLGLARGLGYRIAGFRVAGDLGAGLSRAGVRQALEGAPDGAIVLLHMNRPEGQTFEGLRDALPALRARGVELVRLGDGAPPAP